MTPEELGNSDAAVIRVRELFAAMAMQGILANLDALRFNGFKTEEIAPFAVMQADALLAQLARAAK
ncbi:MAG: hypothetical protein E6Q97_22635 [Desulfurellales bacterium]|nr:MAG: hypothetical protein E6Q97_22635 [Desulfurellales bacterium]